MVAPVSVPVSATVDQRTMGHYVIVAELGCGALGRVYGAEDLKTARKVGLRVFAPEVPEADLADVRARFVRAAHEAENLNHPNIVNLHEIGTFADGTPYIETELLIGLTLRESIDGGIVFPLHKVIDVAMLILRGLDYAHQQGVVHRDLKPANIMLAHNGMVKIMDFAIAIAAESGRTLAPALPGSLAYRAPEQLSGGAVDARSDLFALGVILYEMLTGKHPFAGDNVTRVAHDIAHLAPPAPATFNPELPPALDGVVMQAIAQDPAARFASAREMSRALAPFCAPLKDGRSPTPTHDATANVVDAMAALSAAAPATEPPATSAAEAPSRPPRKRAIVLTGAAVLVGILLLSQLMSTRDDTEDDRADALPPASVIASGDASGAAVSAPPASAAPPPATIEAGNAEPVAPAAVTDLAASELELETPPPITPTPAPSTAFAPEPASESALEAEPASASGSRIKPATPPPGKLGLTVLPWGEVYVNGRKRGVTPPLRELALPPGTHRIEIRNADFPPYVQRLTIRSGQSIRIRHRFQ